MSSTRSLVPVPAPGVPVPAPGAPAITPALPDEMTELEEAALSPRTREIYQNALEHCYRWLDSHDWPMKDETLASYLHARYDGRVPKRTGVGYMRPAAPSTIALIVSAARSESKLAGTPNPVGVRTVRTLGGIRRQGAGRSRGSVSGLRWSQVQHICNVALEGEAGLLELRGLGAVANHVRRAVEAWRSCGAKGCRY